MNPRAIRNLIQPEHPAFIGIVLFLLTIAYSYPVIFHLSDYMVGGTSDAYQFPWNSFVFREQILHLKDPYFTDYIFYPVGTSLLLHSYTEFNSIVALAMVPVVGYMAAYNIATLLSTFLTAIGMYLLARKIIQNSFAALFASVAFAFAPFRIISLFGHINFALTQWIPFSFWALCKLGETPRARAAFLTALFIALTCYSNYYYGIFLAIAFVLILIYGVWRVPGWRSRRFLLHLPLVGAFLILLMAPIGLHFYRDYTSGAVYPHGLDLEQAEETSAHIPQFVTVAPTNTFLQDLLGKSPVIWPYSKLTPGWTVLILALGGVIWSIRLRNHRLIMFSVMGLFFYLLSLGPALQVGRYVIFMPYYLIGRIPYVDHVRIPLRFAYMGILAATLTAGYQVSLISQKLSGWKKSAVPPALLLLLLFELACFPLPMTPFDPPGIFRSIAQSKADQSMITVPFTLGASASSYVCDQIVHTRKLLTGRISRQPPLQVEYFSHLPILESLHALSMGRAPDKHIEQDRIVAPFFRHFFRVRYVTLYPPFSSQPATLDYIHQVFPDASLLSTEKGISVFSLPGIEKQPIRITNQDTAMRLFLFSGWHVKLQGEMLQVFTNMNQPILLLPAAEKDQDLDLKLILRSRHAGILRSGKLKFSVAGVVMKETKLTDKFQEVAISVPGEILSRSGRLMQIKIEYPQTANSEMEALDHPKLELRAIKASIR